MFTWVRGLLSGTVYIQAWESRLKIVHIESTRVYDQKPWIALSSKNGHRYVKSVGDEAYSMQALEDVIASNPFSHPRLLVADFRRAEKILQHGLRIVCGERWFNPSPVVVMHPRERLEGGITEVECRLFRELCFGAGARKVHLHVGAELSISSFSLSDLCNPEPL